MNEEYPENMPEEEKNYWENKTYDELKEFQK